MFILNYREHVEKADYNNKVLHKYFYKYHKKCPGWICVMAFYSALHYVDAYLLRRHGIRRIHHEERNADVSQLIREIEEEYLRLYNYGNNARYDKMRNLPDEEDSEQAATKDLLKIQEYILGFF